MKITRLSIPEVILISTKLFPDGRGSFQEIYKQSIYAKAGIIQPFVQDNWSRSRKNVLRGMHYQINTPQAKLLTVIRGAIFDVAVDVRVNSPTFGKWVGETLSDENRNQMFIPTGFAHGFYVLSNSADVLYKCSCPYSPSDERGILWNDPDLAISWPVKSPILSDRDTKLPPLGKVSHDNLPCFINQQQRI